MGLCEAMKSDWICDASCEGIIQGTDYRKLGQEC